MCACHKSSRLSLLKTLTPTRQTLPHLSNVLFCLLAHLACWAEQPPLSNQRGKTQTHGWATEIDPATTKSSRFGVQAFVGTWCCSHKRWVLTHQTPKRILIESTPAGKMCRRQVTRNLKPSQKTDLLMVKSTHPEKPRGSEINHTLKCVPAQQTYSCRNHVISWWYRNPSNLVDTFLCPHFQVGCSSATSRNRMPFLNS